MKVLMVHDHDCRLGLHDGRVVATAGSPGGIGIYLATVMNALVERGCEVAGLRYQSGECRLNVGGPQYHLRSGSQVLDADAIDGLKRIVDDAQPDLVHLHSVYFAMHPRAINALSGWVPTIQTIHDVTPICFRGNKLLKDGTLCTHRVGGTCVVNRCFVPGEGAGVLKDTLRVINSPRILRAYKGLTRTLVPSGYIRDELLRNGFARDSVDVIPLFSRFSPEAESLAIQRESVPCILYVGRITEEKGIFALLSALSLLARHPWKANIVGEGPALAEAMVQAARYGLAERIRFSASADSAGLTAHYRSADMVVVPSLIPESFNLVGVEAMSFSLPVVAFHSGGISEWLIPEETGLLVPHGRVDRMAAAIERLLLERELRMRIGQRGRAMVQEKFTVEHHVERLSSLYETLVKQPAEAL